MNAQDMYKLDLKQIADLIAAVGTQRTVLVQGDMGTGKSSLLPILGELLPTHILCYFDCTTKDVVDISIPNVVRMDGEDFVRFVLNEELGLHHDGPVILMIDEYGKNRSIQNSLLRLMLERQIGGKKLHPDSIVFATTNLGAEGVGDILPAHARNRITVVTSRKPDSTEWITWGLSNGIDHTLLGWVKDNPHVMQSFTEVEDPESNPYIFHPRAQRTAFVTPRSLHAASDIIKQRDNFDDTTLTAALMGTIGDRAAMDLMAFVRLADQLPRAEEIKKSPTTAPVPTSAAAVCMVVYRALASIAPDWVDAWMTYLQRLDVEAQAMFACAVMKSKYPHQSVVVTNRQFSQWAIANNYMFTADK